VHYGHRGKVEILEFCIFARVRRMGLLSKLAKIASFDNGFVFARNKGKSS